MGRLEVAGRLGYFPNKFKWRLATRRRGAIFVKRLGLALLCLVVLNPGVVATEYAPAEGYRFLADPSTRLTYQVFLKDCVPCSAALVLLDDRGPIYARVAWLYSDNVSVAVRTPEAEARVTLVAETDPSGEYVVGVESFPIPNLPGPTEITAYTFASSPSTRAFHLEGGTVLGHSTSDRTFWSTSAASAPTRRGQVRSKASSRANMRGPHQTMPSDSSSTPRRSRACSSPR
jgi:hypothetical protein